MFGFSNIRPLFFIVPSQIPPALLPFGTGLIDEGKAALRLKHTMTDGKLDPVAFRIKFHEHHRTKAEWCIYPTYDYTHCLCDSFEDITHSLCTKEFEGRRPSYYWLCNAVDVYCPVQWEYSRLNVAYTLVSKRKLKRLIDLEIVRDWDDPRLFTLSGLKRRGFPPQAVKNFCELVGVTEATDTVIQPAVLESCVRDVLNATATRAMAVLQPLEVEIVNFPSTTKTVTVDNIPANVCESESVKNTGVHTVDVCSKLYIEAEDFSESPPKGYKRLTAGQSVGLMHLGLVMTLKEVVKTGGVPTKLICEVASGGPTNKPKGAYIHWVSSSAPGVAPQTAEVRVYQRLFKSVNPESNPGGLLADVTDDNLVVHPNAMINSAVKGGAVGSTYQFVRGGYYCKDPDSTPTSPVFNLTIGLKGEGKK
jgi:glutaminyl-tRNA synthetase